MKAVIALGLSISFGVAALGATPTKEAKPKGKPAAKKPIAKPTQLDLLKGEWIACRPAINETGEPLKTGAVLSLQDRYSQTAPLEYAQVVASASDKECKKIVSEVKTTLECDEMSPEMLSCKTKKREERKAGGKWKPTPMLDHAGVENHYSIKLTVTSKDPDTVELTVFSDESEERETFQLKRSTR